jgi:hypothetical protein
LRRRRPELEAGAAVPGDGTEVGHVIGRGIEVVQGARDLGRRRVLHLAVGVFLHQHELLLVQGGQAGDVGGAHREDRAAGHVLEAQRVGSRHGAGEGIERDVAVSALHGRFEADADLAGGRVIEAHRAAGGDAGPLDQALVQPDGAGVGAGDLAQVRRGGVDGGVALHQPDLADLVLDVQRGVLDVDVVGAAVLVVLVGRHAVDDEFQALAIRVALRVQHGDVEHHFAVTHRVARHGAQRHGLAPVVDVDA